MVKFAVFTLGCKVNQYETQALSERFARLGFTPCPFNEVADLYLINSCSVTATAEHKSLQQLRKARHTNPNAKVVITGCWAQLTAFTELEIPEADLLVLNPDKETTPELILQSFPEFAARLTQPEVCVAELSHRKRTRATIKIQDGCTNRCSYCSIPLTRPELTSRPISDICDEVRGFVASGSKELVITGIQVGAYGLGTSETLPQLISALSSIDGLARIRLSSIEPNDISKQLIELMVNDPKICPHIHIPLQAGDDEVLRRMNRHYSSEFIISLAHRLQRFIPDIAITTDIIVGFPGETEEAFTNTLAVCREIGFAKAHVFRFSARPNTPALSMDGHISESTKENRSHRLITLCNELQNEFMMKFSGRSMPVLVEGRPDSEGMMKGFTPNYIPVHLKAPRSLSGKIVPVELTDLKNGFMTGHLQNTKEETNVRLHLLQNRE